jgi:hypothetical protein
MKRLGNDRPAKRIPAHLLIAALLLVCAATLLAPVLSNGGAR